MWPVCLLVYSYVSNSVVFCYFDNICMYVCVYVFM